MVDRVGQFWVGLIFAIIVINLIFLVKILDVTWGYSEPNVITADGYIRGSDFIAL